MTLTRELGLFSASAFILNLVNEQVPISTNFQFANTNFDDAIKKDEDEGTRTATTRVGAFCVSKDRIWAVHS